MICGRYACNRRLGRRHEMESLYQFIMFEDREVLLTGFLE